jgi:hypothetical protein
LKESFLFRPNGGDVYTIVHVAQVHCGRRKSPAAMLNEMLKLTAVDFGQLLFGLSDSGIN